MATTSFELTMKDYMLNQWRGQTLSFRAFSGITEVGSAVTITFVPAANGEIALNTSGGAPRITIPEGETIDRVRVTTAGGIQLEWVIPDITFTFGGDLILTDLVVSIGQTT